MMTPSAARPARGSDVLAEWAQSLTGQTAGRSRGRLRFAFYGRVSTEDWQDPVTSRARQLQQAVMLTAGRGVIVAEFFDTGESRTLPWARRLDPTSGDRGRDADVLYAARLTALAMTASRMTLATMSDCDSIRKWEAPSTSVTVEPARSYEKRWRSGATG